MLNVLSNDEPPFITASALDFESERVVQDALDKIREQRKLTTITVAHRLTTIINSDKIVVIADGTIQESGTHCELYQLGGIYTSLCEGQGLTAETGSKNGAIGTINEDVDVKKMETDEEVGTMKLENADSDVEKAEAATNEQKLAEDGDDDDVPDITGVDSRLQKFNKSELAYSIAGYAGGIIVGCLPAAEAILFGFITGNFYIQETGQELLAVNIPICYFFILLAGCSFIGNILMGVGKSKFARLFDIYNPTRQPAVVGSFRKEDSNDPEVRV